MVAEFGIATVAQAHAALTIDHGYRTRAWMYDTLALGDADYARAVHDAPSLVPFTCSELLGPRHQDAEHVVVRRGEEVHLRVTTLTRPALIALQRGLRNMPDAIRIDADEGGANGGPVPLLVRGVRLVQKRTYRQFADVPHARHWRLRFLSRTSLTTGDKKSLLPLPESMLGGLGRKWNAFAAADRPTHPLYTPTGPLLEALTGNVMIMEIDTLSTTPNGPGMLASRGFVGTVTLSVTDDLPRAVFDAFCRVVYFARFAGIGERTTEGWGRVEVTAL